MQKRTKKVLAMLLATTTAIGCLSGCGQGASKESSEVSNNVESTSQISSEVVEEPSLFNVGTLPIVNEPITLKVLTIDKATQKASEDGVWKWLEEQTGIHFEIESYSSEEMKSKLPLIMATPDDMPDLFINCNFTEADIVQYGQNGQILALDELIEEYGTNTKAMFEETETGYGAAVASDGHIYSLPAMNGVPTYVYYSINTRFLENSGIEKVPTTLEELYDAMVIMRKSDANGDGIVGNEILWSSVPKVFKRQALGMVGLKCYWPWQGCLFDDKDGEVFFVPTSEEYKYLLTVLNNMYEIGAIDQEIFTQTANEYKDKFFSDLTFMGERTDDPEASGYTGQTGSAYIAPFTSAVHDEPTIILGSDYQTNFGSISAYTEYPEICMLLMDFMYTDEASVISHWGMEGVDFKVTSEEPWTIEKISDDIPLKQGPTTHPMPKWIREDRVQQAATALGRTRDELVAEYGKFGWQNYVKLTTEEADEVSVISADLGLYCDDYFVGFITGSYDIEKDWDAYVKTCESMKLKEITEVYQAAYNRFMGVK